MLNKKRTSKKFAHQNTSSLPNIEDQMKHAFPKKHNHSNIKTISEYKHKVLFSKNDQPKNQQKLMKV